MVIIDGTLLKYKPSILAAGLIFAAIRSIKAQVISQRTGESGKGRIDILDAIYREFRCESLDRTFEVPEIDKILVFSELLSKRMSELHSEFS